MNLKPILIAAVLAISLGGCASIPIATGIALGTLGVATGTLMLNSVHDCRLDGGCKAPALPK
jgi:hypothetical protein